MLSRSSKLSKILAMFAVLYLGRASFALAMWCADVTDALVRKHR